MYHLMKAKFCLNLEVIPCQGIPRYSMSERFFEDDLENYFRILHGIEQRCDKPIIRDFRYNNNTTKSQFSVRPTAGNIQGAAGNFNQIRKEPLSKRKKADLP